MSRETRIAGIRRLFHLPASRDAIEREVDDEIRFHLESRIADLVAAGLTPDAARDEAEREFGDATASRREIAAVDVERLARARRADWWDGLWRDARYALRGLRRQPAFTATVALTLALGIGANATIFGVVDRLLLRPPRFLGDPDRTGRVYLVRNLRDGSERIERNINYRRYAEIRTATKGPIEEMAAFFTIELVAEEGEAARPVQVGMVSASFWPMFEIRPAAGRFFGEAEDRFPEGTPVAVLGHSFWQTRYGGSSSALGKTIRLGGRVYTIIGVAPPGFTGMSPLSVAAFVPITASAMDVIGPEYGRTYNSSWMEILARRRADVSPEAANAAIGLGYRRTLEEQWRTISDPPPMERVRPRAILGSALADRGPTRQQGARVALWLLGVAVVVLLVACANVTNLLLTRAAGRRRELAVRVALGVSRARLTTQLLLESIALAVLGGAAGLLLAHWGGRIVRAALVPDLADDGALADPRILLFGGAIALLAGAITGIMPALRASRPDVADALKGGGREGSHARSRTRTTLLVVQAALSVVLLVGAGLFVRSLHNVRTLELGFEPSRMLYVRPDLRGVELSEAQRVQLLRRMAERARELPAVEQAATTAGVPFWMSLVEDLIVPDEDSVNSRGDFFLNAVSPEYFATAGTRIERGRGIAATDVAGSPPVVVVSRSAARAIWRDENVLGKCIRVGADTAPCREVVGIAQDVRWGTFADDGGLQVYVSDQQHRTGRGLYLRTRGEARQVSEDIRRELQRLMPGTAYVEARPLADLIDPNVRPWKLGATMFSVFGLLALLTSAVGLYSVIAYGVSQRRHEFGVRMALGAGQRDIVRMVVGGGLRVAIVGVALGIALALIGARYVAPLLFNVPSRDPATYSVVVVVLLLVAVTAGLVPARRASRVDPASALRSD